MSKNNKNKLIPKLRFPEFENEGEWNKKSFEKFCLSISSGKDKNAIEGEYDLYGSTGIIGKSENANYDGAFILVARVGANAGQLNKVKGKFGVTDNTLVIDLIKKDLINFIFYSLDKIGLNRLVFGSGQPLITGGQLKSLLLCTPNSEQEQQKIAACLSSLDEVITAESQKMEVLKDHKKGLLQGLFPQQFETGFTRCQDEQDKEEVLTISKSYISCSDNVPKFRFKEFEDSGEWEVAELSKLGYLINGLTYSPEDIRDKGLLVLRSSNIQDGLIDLKDCVYVREDMNGANLTKPKDILVCVRNGSKNLIGKSAIIPEGIPFATHGAFMTVFRANNPAFVFQLFQSDYYDKQVKADLGATINSINGKNFIKYEFPVPKKPKEQEKIASTLSSLDDLINAQQQKIEALQLHKKGLLQGLFPTLSETGFTGLKDEQDFKNANEIK